MISLSTTAGADVVLRGVHFEYPKTVALRDVNAQAQAGHITALVGPNGSGKTTLLRCIAGLETPISGSIEIGGMDALAHPRETQRILGFLLDVYGLYDGLTVEQCLWFAARNHAIAGADVVAALLRSLTELNLLDKRDALVGSLSHGQRQRVAIAQATVHRPRLLLLDEPANGLDPQAREDLAQLLRQLAAQGMSLIVSSHILAELDQYATNMLIMDKGTIVDQHQLVDAAVHQGNRLDGPERALVGVVVLV